MQQPSTTEFYVEKIAQTEIKIYPNPTTEKITLVISGWETPQKGNFTLYSLTGQLLQEYPVHSLTYFSDIEYFVFILVYFAFHLCVFAIKSHWQPLNCHFLFQTDEHCPMLPHDDYNHFAKKNQFFHLFINFAPIFEVFPESFYGFLLFGKIKKIKI